MLCALSVRQLKPGMFERFREAWEPEEWLEGFSRAYHLRAVEDESQIVSFGFFEGSLEDLKRLQADEHHAQIEQQRQRRIGECVETTRVDRIFEVVEEVRPPGR
jgi:heme-degrading monooxygenase HmoA